MKTVESLSMLESFGLVSEGKGMFSEVSEIDMTDVVGGSCGAGSSFTFPGTPYTPPCCFLMY